MSGTETKKSGHAKTKMEYQFEQVINHWLLAWGKAGRRPYESAKKDAEVLLDRIFPADKKKKLSDLSEDAQKDLVRFCVNVTQSIAWYERARIRMSLWQNTQYLLVFGFGAGSVAVIVHFMEKFQNVAFAQAGAVLGAFVVVLQVMASALDTKAVIAGFREACANLKEQLYDFEDNWRGANSTKVLDEKEEKNLSKDFTLKLQETGKKAREIERTERSRFFNTLKSPSELLASVNAALEGLRGKRTEFQAAQEAATKQATTVLTANVQALLQKTSTLRTQLDSLKGKSEREIAPIRDELIRVEKEHADAVKALLGALGT